MRIINVLYAVTVKFNVTNAMAYKSWWEGGASPLPEQLWKWAPDYAPLIYPKLCVLVRM